ncbi:MAG: adenylosuccinate synthetase [Nanoarchaeota archaeon]|nr:adenylosuccinate synthetase [Nanoarchaeota archaeon]
MRKGSVDCLVGLQWGSEGKGKISAYLAREYNAMIRSGGPQAGHSFYVGDKKFVNRQIPCGVFNPDCYFYLSASSLINLDVLNEEIQRYGICPDRLMIDNHAMVVTDKHVKLEGERKLKERLASTLEGVGAAQVEKVWREAKVFDSYASEIPELYFFCNDTESAIDHQILAGHTILLEGTQGFGLSLNHGDYPYVTSRDVTSSALLADAGIAPKFHGQTIGVMRTYPIRVGGNSGPTGSDELTWEEIAKRSGSPKSICEYTTLTGRQRRIFEQSSESLEKAVKVNQPDQIALMFIDYINHEDYGKSQFEDLSEESRRYVFELEDESNIPITLIGTGPKTEHIIDRREDFERRKAKSNIHKEMRWFFPDNFMGTDWESGYWKRYTERMTA